MSYPCVTLDSNVFTKVFLDEEHSVQARDCIRMLTRQKIPVICPDIFLYEILSIAAQNSFPISEALRLLRSFENANLSLQPLNGLQLELAIKMAEEGHPKSGYPSIYDSSYHALAIAHQGLFITADGRNIAKAKQFGDVCHLSEISDYLDMQ